MTFSREETGVSVSVVVPTYCEAENLAVLIPRLSAALRQHQFVGEILIVDDNSPDGTAEVCLQLSEHHPVKLLVRKSERGLSSAVIAGMRQAVGEVIVVMDADLSHPPESVADVVFELRRKKADFVIGSRYIEGGKTDENWSWFRWLNSKVATFLARPLTTAKDPMAGFFAIGRQRFEQADRLDPVGYKIGLELMVKCNCQRICEVPILFSDRLHGKSKLTVREQLNYLRHLKRLYAYKYSTSKKSKKGS